MSFPEDKLFPDCFNYLPGIFRKSFFFFYMFCQKEQILSKAITK